MKNLKRLFVALFAALLFPVVASAAVDMFLKIENAKGDKRVVHVQNDVCVVEGLAVGKFLVTVCDAQGKLISTDVALDSAIVSPRDVASGQSTGKRMHKPITITKEVGRSVAGAPPPNEIAIDEPGVHLVIGVTTAATDTAAAKITKSRSNIQNN